MSSPFPLPLVKSQLVAGRKKSAALDLSVVICTKNRKKLCLRALDSLAKLKLLPAVVVVIDASENIVLGHAIKKKNWAFKVKYYHIEDQGLAQSRNFAIANIGTEYFAFIDDDEVVPAQFTEVIREELIAPKRQVLAGWAKVLYPDNYWNQIWSCIWPPMEDEVGKLYLIPTACSAFATNVIQKLPIYFDHRLKKAAEEEFFTKQVNKYVAANKMKASNKFWVWHDFRTDWFGFAQQFFNYGEAQALRCVLEKQNLSLGQIWNFYQQFGYRMSAKNNYSVRLWPGLLLKNVALWAGFLCGTVKYMTPLYTKPV